MSTKQKNTVSYKTPFSLAYWKDAFAEAKSTKMLIMAALMIAIRVVLKLFYIPLAPNLRIQIDFLANALGAMIYGPVVAGIGAVVSDLLGVMLTDGMASYFPPFVLVEIAGSVIFALFFYRARLTPGRIILARFTVSAVANVLLQNPIMMLYYQVMLGGKHYALTIPRILKNLVLFPLESILLILLLSAMVPVTNRLQLTYSAGSELRLGKKQFILLGVLFILGCVLVGIYLNYLRQAA